MTTSIPISQAEYSTLKGEVKTVKVDLNKSQNDYAQVKRLLEYLVSESLKAAKLNVPTDKSKTDEEDLSSYESCASSCSEYEVPSSLVSISSIPISDDEISLPSSTPMNNTQSQAPEVIPSLYVLVNSVSKGEVTLCPNVLAKIQELSLKMAAILEVTGNLQDKLNLLTDRLDQIDLSIAQINADIANIMQYFKIDNLLLHRKVPFPNFSSTLECCQYVVDLLNKLLPSLPIPISLNHISTAHYLPTKAKRSSVVVVRLSNRFIKDMIYEHRHEASDDILITEHLTDDTKAVFDTAKKLFGRNYVETVNCKTVIRIDGKSFPVKSISDVHKSFVRYCERVGSNDNYVFMEPVAQTPKLPTPSLTTFADAAHSSSSTTVNFTPSGNSYRKDFPPTQSNGGNNFPPC